MPQSRPPSEIDSRLQRELRELAEHIRARRLHLRSARRWIVLAVVSAIVLALGWRYAALTPFVFPALAIAFIVVGWQLARLWRREPFDYHTAATWVERKHPDLQQALRTALEQRPDENGRYTFLQRRVIDRALKHALRNDWRRSRDKGNAGPALAHAAALIAMAALLGLSIRPPDKLVSVVAAPQTGEISITPGNAEVERGSTVVIAARFNGALPRNAMLVWSNGEGEAQRVPMARSLSDPVFAYTLPRVERNIEYRVEHDGGDTDPFHLSVYDLPALVQADASLDYPEYTGLIDRRIEDTRRISAVEGTQVEYDFMLNKPVQSAVLRAGDGSEIALTAANPERTRYTTSFTIAESKRYTLHLVDDAARRNPSPPDVRIEALVNRPPDLKVVFPRGDQRVSAIEEIPLEGEARDDFGLLDYGLAVAIGANEPNYISLRAPDEKTAVANFQHMLALETHGVAPDELVTWFAWAEDAGSDGAPRRVTSDLFFGEVRPFDEIFREEAEAGQQQQQQQQGGMGQQGDDLIELQRQISIAIWKLKQRTTPPDSSFLEDVGALAEAQGEAMTRLSAITEQLRDERMRKGAADAARFMQQARDNLEKSTDERAVRPLDGAWTGAQGALQALMQMQPRETRVAQQRGQRGQGGGNRNQRQLNQLRFRNNDDNYETESQAESMTSPEQREQLQVLSRLRELSRRQQDVNERLQQLQTALQEARSAEERERIERELKRLEEEQRRMLADLDDVRQRVERQSPGSETRDAREQLEQTREDMRRTSEALEQGNVSQALASGTRAQDNLEDVSDDLRRQTSSRFAEQLREARRTARDLAESQAQTEQELEQFEENGPRALDGSERRTEIADRLDQQRQDLERLLSSLREVTEESEVSEPALHRQLYDLLRQQDQSAADDQMRAGSELLRRGFVDQARELQPEVTRDLEQLRRGVERAAESVLGDEASTLRFAQSELEELARELQGDRPAEAGEQAGTQPGRELGGQQGIVQNQPGQPGEQNQPGGPGMDREGQAEQPGQQPGQGAAGREPSQLAENQRGAGTQPGQEEGQQRGTRPGEQQGNQPGPGNQPGTEVASNNQPGQQPGQRSGAQQGQQGQQGQGQQQGQANQQSSQPGQQPGQGGGGQGGDQQQQQSSSPTQVAQGGQQRGGNQPGGQERTGGGGGGGAIDDLSRALEAIAGEEFRGGGNRERGPITGEDFLGWNERLRTVESLLDSPEARERLAQARELAERLRAEYRRHSAPPQWGTVESGIVAPLSEVRTWLRQELARREDPESLQPVDRDPVPERFAEAVQKYYEALGR